MVKVKLAAGFALVGLVAALVLGELWGINASVIALLVTLLGEIGILIHNILTLLGYRLSGQPD